MSELKVSVVKTDSVERLSDRRGSKYDEIIERVLQLEEGKSLLVQVPNGLDPSKFRNLLNNSIRHHLALDGLDPSTVRFFVTRDGESVEIYVMSDAEMRERRLARGEKKKKGGK